MSVSHPTAITVLERDGYTCARCRRPYDHIHHRRPKRMGGSSLADTDLAPNLVCLCNQCHTEVHGYGVEASQGFLLRDGADPAAEPLFWRGRWVLLSVKGDIVGHQGPE